MSHRKPATVAELCFVQLPMEATQWEEGVVSLYLGASGESANRRAVGADNTIRFCQISQPLHGYVFMRGGLKPSQKFPELLHELWPGPEGKAYTLS